MTERDVTRVQEALPYGFEDTSFQAVGGIKGIKRLVATFYQLLDTTPEAKDVRALYPEDLSGSKEKLGRYLCDWLGGPSLYRDKFGKIKIAKAHARFDISPSLSDAWIRCMHLAIDKQAYSEKFSTYFKEQIRNTAKRIEREHAEYK
ncbi:MAG: group II truncated hemoglobin [Agarilytica sp.]